MLHSIENHLFGEKRGGVALLSKKMADDAP
jgi:hypothetical protein